MGKIKEEHEYEEYKPSDSAGILAKAFIRSPLTVVLGVFLIAIGYISLLIMPREENPQMVVSGSTVIVALPGATAEEVLQVIVKPLERKLKEVKGVQHLHGMALDNVGIVNASFFIGETKADSNLKIYDKIMQNNSMFPKGAMNPLVKPLDIDIDIPIVTVAFYSNDPNADQTKLYDSVKEIQYHINSLHNVAVTNIKGGHKTQFNVEVDINKLAGYNLSLGQIVKSIESLAYNVPPVKNTTKDHQLAIVSVKNAIDNEKDIGRIIVASYRGSPIYLYQVAKIKKSYDIQNFKSSYIAVQRRDGGFSEQKRQVTLTVSKLQGTNAVNISNAVRDELELYKDYLSQKGINYVITRNDGSRADEAVNELVYHLVLSIIIIAVLLIFVLGWRESIIVTVTVPMILAVTLFVAYLGGQTINRITLFAFLLSLGLLVDAAIIVIENIHRHYHNIESRYEPVDDLMVRATDEIGPATNIATLAIIMTMVPMAFVGQMMGQFMKPIPQNVPVALVASLFVAYIFTPYLAVRMLKRPDFDKEGGHH